MRFSLRTLGRCVLCGLFSAVTAVTALTLQPPSTLSTPGERLASTVSADGSQAPLVEREAASVDMTRSSAQIPFIANEGQTDERVAYYAHTFGGTVFVTREGAIVYALPAGDGDRGVALTEALVDARTIAVAAGEPAGVRISSFTGNDPARWVRDAPAHDSVELGEVYPGIDVTLTAHANNVEKLFFVAPGADPSDIRMAVAGADRLQIDAQGRLEAITEAGTVRFSAPVAFQEREGIRQTVAVAYTVEDHQYGFALGAYDPSRPLVIDPTLASTLLGGSDSDSASFPIIDASGDVYVMGGTTSIDFPATVGAYDGTASPAGDLFLAKFDHELTTLLAATYFGGSSTENNASFALDSAGNVFLGGRTSSADIPMVGSPYQPARNAGDEAFLAKFSGDLTTLLASTYLGANRNDAWCCGFHIQVASDDTIFVGMLTNSTDFTARFNAAAAPAHPYDSTYNDYDTDDVVLFRFDNDLTTLLAGTYIGGSLWDIVYGMRLDSADNVYIVGRTSSSNYPTTAGRYQGNSSDPWPYYDGYISKLSPDLTTLMASTYYGTGADLDILWDVQPAPDGTIYVVGSTKSPVLPMAGGGYDSSYNGGAEDGFVARFSGDLTSLLASSFLGGSGYDRTTSLMLDADGNVHLGGHTESSNFPITPGAFDTVFDGGPGDGIYVRMDGNLTTLQTSTFVGGLGGEGTSRPVLDAAGNVYLGGTTSSPDFPLAPAAYDGVLDGPNDAFVIRLGDFDTTAPTFDGPSPGDVLAEATSAAGAVVVFSTPTATDDTDPAPTVACAPPSGSTFGFGTTTVTCTASDLSGNTTDVVFDVTVEDTTPPAISLPVSVAVEATDPAGAVVTFAASATDLVDGSVVLTCTHSSGSVFPIATTPVSCEATDTRGNHGVEVLNVIVEDTTPPTVTPPADIVIEATETGGTTLLNPAVASFLGGASAADAVAGTGLVVTNDAPGLFPIGDTKVTFFATDGFANTGSATATVTVQDTADPVFTSPPDDVTALVTGSPSTAVSFATPAATDVADDSLDVVCVPASGSDFPLGTTLVTCTATDDAGNAATVSFNVVVLDDTDGDGTADVDDPDDDNDGVPDGEDSDPLDRFVCSDVDADTADDCSSGTFDPSNDGTDTDGDGLADVGDPDDDNDGVPDGEDSAPLNRFVCSDVDGDTADDCSSGTFDPSNDGTDTDGDGLADVGDPDDDNDGVLDGNDTDPLNPSVCEDVDADGADDCSIGVDGFGPLPDNDPSNDGLDTDGDGLADVGDPDDDNDGVPDGDDSAPLNRFVCSDVDADTADDCSSGTFDPANDGTDTDGDGLADVGDPDDDNDGVLDGNDTDPLNPSVCEDVDADGADDCSVGVDGFGPLPDNDPSNDGLDTDGDGLADVGDPDDDNDGVPDGEDSAPLNRFVCSDVDGDTADDCSSGTFDPSNDGTDTDGDGLADVGDPDDDNDGVLDGNDTDPLNPSVCEDVDADGADDCSVGVDGFGPLPDNDPSNDGLDTDGDGLADVGDPDDDNDGVPDGDDPAPLDPDADDDGLTDGEEIGVYGTDPLDWDTDDDGISDGDEVANGTDPLSPEDGTAPTIAAITPSQTTLWPLNKALVPIVLTVSVTDDLDPNPVCVAVAATHDEATGPTGDGRQDPDWQLLGGLNVALRAERNGNGDGRTYTVTVECRDASNNVSLADVAIFVPHDQGNGGSKAGKKQ